MTTHDDGKLSGVGAVDTADYTLAVVDIRDDGLVILKCHSIEDDMNREEAISPVIAGTTTLRARLHVRARWPRRASLRSSQ
ncbi:MAG: hypothetical protein JOZ49_01130 [Mycolicibacterium sp.]|nr:hypothetical protein [Mycolicibacterium sp.]